MNSAEEMRERFGRDLKEDGRTWRVTLPTGCSFEGCVALVASFGACAALGASASSYTELSKERDCHAYAVGETFRALRRLTIGSGAFIDEPAEEVDFELFRSDAV